MQIFELAGKAEDGECVERVSQMVVRDPSDVKRPTEACGKVCDPAETRNTTFNESAACGLTSKPRQSKATTVQGMLNLAEQCTSQPCSENDKGLSYRLARLTTPDLTSPQRGA